MFAGNVRETTSISSLVTTSTHDVYDIKMADKLVVWLSGKCLLSIYKALYLTKLKAWECVGKSHSVGGHMEKSFIRLVCICVCRGGG